MLSSEENTKLARSKWPGGHSYARSPEDVTTTGTKKILQTLREKESHLFAITNYTTAEKEQKLLMRKNNEEKKQKKKMK